VLAGDPVGKELLLIGAKEHGIDSQITFLGHINDVSHLLENIDVFTYILNPQHYGATENALLEAMAAGIPTIALNQCVERMIVDDKETGLLIDSPESFGKAVKALHDDEKLWGRISFNARQRILCNYAIQDNRERILSRYDVCMSAKKKAMNFTGYFGNRASEWFLSAVEEDKDCFTSNQAWRAGRIFRESTKGSPKHFLRFFPDDELLQSWASQVEAV